MKEKKKLAEKQEQAGNVTPISNKLERVDISKDEQAEVRALNANLDNVKIALGNLDLEFETKRNALFQAYSQANKSLTDRVGAIARLHGIDPDADPAKSKWNFDTIGMTFTRVT